MANSVDPDQTTFSDAFFFLGALRVYRMKDFLASIRRKKDVSLYRIIDFLALIGR